MAPPAGTLRVGRYFLALAAILALLGAIVAFGSRHTPKLGIDLVGGTEVRFTARTTNGQAPSASSMEQARQIIAERVNGTGVTQAQVVVQGNDQLVVSVPGQDASGDIEKLGAAAKLNFRGVIAPPVPVGCTSPTASGSGSATAPPSPTDSASTSSKPASAGPSGSGASSSPSSGASSSASSATSSGAPQSGAAASERPLAKASTPATKTASGTAKTSAKTSAPASPTGSATTSGTGSATPSGSATAAAPAKCTTNPLALAAKAGKFTIPKTDTEYAKLPSTNQSLLQAALAAYDCDNASSAPDPAKDVYIACASGASYGASTKYIAFLLGPVIVPGTQIDSADAVAPNQNNAQWTVSLTLKGSGSTAWANYTGAHNIGSSGSSSGASVTSCSASTFPCADFVAFTLDGLVVSAPVNESAINGLPTQISGSFTQTSATDLANKLKFGALPLSFKADQAYTVSATLGTQQLEAGLIAGGIGLLLVVIYSLLYYRALGLVTIASLLVSGALTYGSLVMLGTQIGFTLSLAGIAGFIIAVGITADSFVVFFERLKDEVHEGRSVRVAVPRAWIRSRRTILSADTVSFLAAAVLYYFTTDEVRGFAFTLGLSTILDLIVVFLFTHPLVSLLSRSRAFGSARFTGLDALRGRPVATESAERPVRRTGGRTASAGKSAAGKPAAGTTTLEKRATDDVSDDVDDDAVVDPRPAEDDLTGTDTEVGTDTDDLEPGTDDDVEPDRPRRRTTPEGGTAAERAAARRARLREQQSGDDPKDESR